MQTRQDTERDPFEVFGDLEAANDRDWRDAAPDVNQLPSPKTGFSWAGLVGGAASLVWAVGMSTGIVNHYGEALLTLEPTVQAALAAWTFAPALLFWIAASAAGEALKARRLAMQLAQGAHFSAEEQSQRAEALSEAIVAAMARMTELETVFQRNLEAFDSAVEASRETVETASQALQHERDALIALNADLRQETEATAQSVSRQIRLLREASKLAKAEIVAAETVLERQLAAFAPLVADIGERTDAFRAAANEAASATASLNSVMGSMLEGLAEATRLADAARQSSEHAVVAANDTASALREVTQGAVVEAKRAAQFIRAETVALKKTPAESLATLQQAAHVASDESLAAAERHAAAAGSRHAFGGARRQTRAYSTGVAANSELKRREARQPSEHFRTWAASAPPSSFVPANEDGSELVEFKRDPAADADESLKRAALGIVAAAGIILERALSPQDLDRIARLSRSGASSRRRAVMDAATGPVGRIARQLKRSAVSRAIATRFRARPDLAKSDDKSAWSDLVRAYLLIDAALD